MSKKTSLFGNSKLFKETKREKVTTRETNIEVTGLLSASETDYTPEIYQDPIGTAVLAGSRGKRICFIVPKETGCPNKHERLIYALKSSTPEYPVVSVSSTKQIVNYLKSINTPSSTLLPYKGEITCDNKNIKVVFVLEHTMPLVKSAIYSPNNQSYMVVSKNTLSI